LASLREPGLERPLKSVEEPWKQWADDPLQVRLEVGITNLYAGTNALVEVKLAGRSRVLAGAGCDTPTNLPRLLADVNLKREYRLTVVSSNLAQVELPLAVQEPWQRMATRGVRQLPKQYTTLVDGVPVTSISAYNTSNGCGYFSNVWNVQIVDGRLAHWYQEDGSDDPSPAPGDGSFLTIGPGKSTNAAHIAIDWSVSLGRLYDGVSAGRLRLRELGLSRAIYTPTNLYYTAASTNVRDQVELVTSSFDGVLRQVKANQSFVDIVAISTNQTRLKFYYPSQVATNKDANGIYTNITGNPFLSWMLLNPQPATTNQFLVIEDRNGRSATNSLVFAPQSTPPTWTLRQGTRAEERVETRAVAMSYSTVTTRVETVTIKYAVAATPAYRCSETYRLFDWGWELQETRVDPDNATGTANDLVTTFAYYETTQPPDSYGRLYSVTYPDGYWEKRFYDEYPNPGALLYVLHPNLNGPDPSTATPGDGTSYAVTYGWFNGSGSGWWARGLAYLTHSYDGGGEPPPLGWSKREVLMNLDPGGGWFAGSQQRYQNHHGVTEGDYSLIGTSVLGKGLAAHPFVISNSREALRCGVDPV